MPATVTLSSTTLQSPCGPADTQIKVASTSGLVIGTRLFIEGELMAVTGLAVSPWVNVQRGVDGTTGLPHNTSATIWIGQPSQFYSSDPIGRPNDVILVSPWINVIENRVWFAQGDNMPAGFGNRYWQVQSTTYGAGSLGIQTSTQSPTSSS